MNLTTLIAAILTACNATAYVKFRTVGKKTPVGPRPSQARAARLEIPTATSGDLCRPANPRKMGCDNVFVEIRTRGQAIGAGRL